MKYFNVNDTVIMLLEGKTTLRAMQNARNQCMIKFQKTGDPVHAEREAFFQEVINLYKSIVNKQGG